MIDRFLSADPRIVEAWCKGWALSRGTPAPVRTDGAFRIEVGLPQHKARYVFPQCNADVRRLAETIHDSEVFIKVCAPPQPVQELLPPRWKTEKTGFMMTQSLSESSERLIPRGYTLTVSAVVSVLIAQVIDSSGFIAASGRVALVEPFAIYDQIQTHEDHRRRNLGSVVMSALRKAAATHGADQGLLVATPDGRALYSSLGWQMHSLYTTAVVIEAAG